MTPSAVKPFGLIGTIACLCVGLTGALPAAAMPSQESPQTKQSQPLPSPSVPSMPSPVPEAIAPESSGILGLYPDPEDNIGVGHLRPANLAILAGDGAERFANAHWLRSVALPIYVEPDGPHWGWIVNGWLVPNGYDPIAIGRDAAFSMLHTYVGLYSFPVMEVREDGWFRFQYTPAGTAWAHLSHLNLGGIELTVESWEDRFLEVGQLEFRQHGISQPLRSQPAPSQSLVYLVGDNSLIEPLEFDGDWMRVRVVQPADGCQGMPGATTEEGWMRWRNSSDRALVWYPSRDCTSAAQAIE